MGLERCRICVSLHPVKSVERDIYNYIVREWGEWVSEWVSEWVRGVSKWVSVWESRWKRMSWVRKREEDWLRCLSNDAIRARTYRIWPLTHRVQQQPPLPAQYWSSFLILTYPSMNCTACQSPLDPRPSLWLVSFSHMTSMWHLITLSHTHATHAHVLTHTLSLSLSHTHTHTLQVTIRRGLQGRWWQEQSWRLIIRVCTNCRSYTLTQFSKMRVN